MFTVTSRPRQINDKKVVPGRSVSKKFVPLPKPRAANSTRVCSDCRRVHVEKCWPMSVFRKKLHSCAGVCVAYNFAIKPPTSSNIEKRFSDFQVFNLFHHNGQIVTINDWPMKFVEMSDLGNLRMTLNKGYSGVFESNISAYFT